MSDMLEIEVSSSAVECSFYTGSALSQTTNFKN
jgi:hypothetical protein